MSASLGLFRLQQIDRQIDRTHAQLDTIRQALENDLELRSVLDQVETAKAEHFHAANTLKNIEAEAGAQKIKIEHAEASLYGGAVKNPKELQDLQKDIVSLKKHLVTLEERELDAMLALENAETALQDAQTKLELLQARRGNEHKNLIEDQTRLAIEIERLTEERSAALAPVDPNLIQIYENLRLDKRGVAITEITDNACASCGGNLNAALLQSARASKIAYCPSCGRILYAN
jgi:predicted  nucleic acid-binding Zn-ribbon protein